MPGRRDRAAVRRARAGARACCALALALGCKTASGGGGAQTGAPAAEAYDKASDFAGEWVGESNGVLGTLEIRALGPGRYYAKFTSDDNLTRFVANMQQALVTPRRGGDLLPGNLVQFTWQDGRGGQGSGWVLINPEDSALIGEIRAGGGGGPWNFVRVDEP